MSSNMFSLKELMYLNNINSIRITLFVPWGVIEGTWSSCTQTQTSQHIKYTSQHVSYTDTKQVIYS